MAIITEMDILTNGDFTKMTNLAKIYLRFGKNQNKMTGNETGETGEFGKD